ncbi:MAG: hypothetical protein HBSAPP03_08100 [Phycisphaerae bacterium]|nr:MAG: hypothetical protein HBSAPP03_08100 [Phycisphaerae bacterium]
MPVRIIRENSSVAFEGIRAASAGRPVDPVKGFEHERARTPGEGPSIGLYEFKPLRVVPAEQFECRPGIFRIQPAIPRDSLDFSPRPVLTSQITKIRDQANRSIKSCCVREQVGGLEWGRLRSHLPIKVIIAKIDFTRSL